MARLPVPLDLAPVLSHLAAGGTLPEYAALTNTPFADLYDLLTGTPEAQAAYDRAIALRAEWMIGRVTEEIRKLAFDIPMKPAARLKALELLGKTVQMFQPAAQSVTNVTVVQAIAYKDAALVPG